MTYQNFYIYEIETQDPDSQLSIPDSLPDLVSSSDNDYENYESENNSENHESDNDSETHESGTEINNPYLLSIPDGVSEMLDYFDIPSNHPNINNIMQMYNDVRNDTFNEHRTYVSTYVNLVSITNNNFIRSLILFFLTHSLEQID